jgi:hypothetical protein
MRKAVSVAVLFLFILLLTVVPSSAGKDQKAKAGQDLVYVCACLGTKSCSCMTEARTEGPCACGTQGGPPLKPVPHDSAWAKENRDALAK